jgi:hypothetical protein
VKWLRPKKCQLENTQIYIEKANLTDAPRSGLFADDFGVGGGGYQALELGAVEE